MDKNVIIQIIIGVVVASIIGVISSLSDAIERGKHNDDIHNIEIEQLKKSNDRLWEYVDEDLRLKTIDAKEQGKKDLEIYKEIQHGKH